MDLFKNIQVGEKTDIGLQRENNEDNYLIVNQNNDRYDTQRYGLMFAVADGMGGHVAGETASQMACDGLPEYYEITKIDGKDIIVSEELLEHLEKLIHRVHEKILQFSNENEGYGGMGTTLSVLVLVETKALIAHVGDSRIYRVREDVIEQLTKDHTEAQVLIDLGRLKPEMAADYPRKHLLMQAIGVAYGLKQVHTRLEEVRKGDVFMLCSDGLHDMLTDEETKTVLKEITSPQAACDRLVDMALERGGRDNVTVIVVRI